MYKKIALFILMFIISVVGLFNFAMKRINEFYDTTKLININWKIDLPKPKNDIETVIDETGGFTGDGAKLVKIKYNESEFNEFLKNINLIPADDKFYPKYKLFLDSVSKKIKLNELVDMMNNNHNIQYKLVEKPSGFLVLLRDTSEPNNFTIYCLQFTL